VGTSESAGAVTEPAQAVLEGALSIEAALRGRSRAVHTLFIRRDLRDDRVLRLAGLAADAGARVERVDAERIHHLASGKTHGGVVALVGERRFAALDELAAYETMPFLVMLDGIEDPFNFGQALRAFWAAGAHGVVVRPRNWMSASSIVARASAGASELMPVAIAETAQAAADALRARGLQIAVTDRRRAVSIYESELAVPLFIIIGGEKRGITRSFADKADVRLRIPYGREFSASLGTTAAAAVLAFEVMRQRAIKQKRG